jgi:hypothetical protein
MVIFERVIFGTYQKALMQTPADEWKICKHYGKH